MNRLRPPRFAEKLLGRLLQTDLVEEIIGDLYEYYDELVELPAWKRSVYFWFHVSQLLRPSLLKSPLGDQKLNYTGMFNINSKIAFRVFLKHRAITISSLLTLILGAICFQLIYSWYDNELHMDRMHSKLDDIFVTAVKTNPEADLTSISLQTMFRLDYSQFPEIRSALQVHVYGKDEIKLVTNNHEFKGKAFIADSTFFEFFDFPAVAWNHDKLLYDPSGIVVTEAFASRMFGEKDALGQIVELKCDQQGTYQISAVLKDIPSNSSISFDFVVPRHSQPFWRRIPQEFVLTDSNLDVAAFNTKIKEIGRANNTRFPESELYLVPLKDSYFDHLLETSLFSKFGSRNTVYTMGFISFMILFITLFGFTNLQSTLQLSLSRKLGIKHVIGGSKAALSLEMVVGRCYLLLIGIGVSMALYSLAFPYLVHLFDLSLDQRPVFDLAGISLFIGGITLISVLTSMAQIYRIKAKVFLSETTQLFKIPVKQRILTTFQYGMTVILLIATAVVYLQFNYMLTSETGLGYTKVVRIDFFEMTANAVPEETEKNYQYIRNELTQNPVVASFSQGNLPVSNIANATSWKKDLANEEYTTQNMMVADPAYTELLGLKVIDGRFFSDSLDEVNQQKVVINEAALEYWNIEDWTTTKLASNTSGRREFSFDIIGVVKDYHYEHLSNSIKPLVLRYRTFRDDSFLIRFQEGQQTEGLAFLEELYRDINPKGTFEYDLLDQRIEAQYQEEKRLGRIYLAFTVIALLLSSICLFTYSFYETQRRTKEIGIRKVIGASVAEIFQLLSLSFLKTITVAYVIAVPLAWYFKEYWISQFENQVTIGWWVYAIAGLLIILAALIATSYQTLMVSRMNPVTSLRYE